MLTKIFNLRGRTLLGAALVAASVMMALFAGCLNPANEADETTAAKSNAPLVPYSIEETTPATPKQAQKAEGFQVPVAQMYYFANKGNKKLYGLWNKDFAYINRRVVWEISSRSLRISKKSLISLTERG
jgi:hypothetical protein